MSGRRAWSTVLKDLGDGAGRAQRSVHCASVASGCRKITGGFEERDFSDAVGWEPGGK